MRTFFLILLFFFVNNKCFSQDGNLDSTFGKNGISAFAFPAASESVAKSEVIQPDGRIIIGGYVTLPDTVPLLALTRFNTDGSLDKGFGDNGQVILKSLLAADAFGGYVALQKDGKIIIGGECNSNMGDRVAFLICRFNANGSLDNTFNGSGIEAINFNTVGNPDQGGPVVIQADGKIVQVGTSVIFDSTGRWSGVENWEIVRYNTDGSVDNTFGTAGVVNTSFLPLSPVAFPGSVVLQPDGKIVVGGTSGITPSSFALARYNGDGMLDSSFGTDGKAILYFGSGTAGKDYDVDECRAIALQPDGKIIAAGSSEFGSDTISILRFARFNNNGTLDSSFGNEGKVATLFRPAPVLAINSICVQPDGRIILAGGGLIRYNKNGSVDSSFGTNGLVLTSYNGIINASADSAANYFNAVMLQTDGKIVVAANTDSGMAAIRFLSGLALGVLNFSSPQNPLLIYPNPIKGQATLQYTLTQNEHITLSLYDMLGRQVQTFFTGQTRTAGEHTEQLPFSSALAAGNYILTITNGHSTQGVKVTVVR